MKKPEVGQVVYSLAIGNAARRHDKGLRPFTVTKVGRKYFYISEYGRDIPFYLSDWNEKFDCSAYHRLYESEKDYEEENQQEELYRELGPKFVMFSRWHRNGNLSLAALKKIKEIIDNDKP